MAHHGMNHLHGINTMCTNSHDESGRFRRLFPHQPSLYTAPSELKKLGGPDGPMDGGKGRNESNSIPLATVFFGQFIDHDITFDTTSQLDKINDPNATENFRTPGLDLDNIYGSGPEASGYLYKDGASLITGADGTAYAGQADEHRNEDLTRSPIGTAIIGDPRNDENRIISQMQLAFIRFHNKVVDHVKNEKGYEGHELYEEARKQTTWHYQWVIVNEFLPLMVGQGLVDDILGNGRKFYTSSDSFIPIEFSAAAYRFGHSLAPQKFKSRIGQAHDFELFGPTLGFGFSAVSRIEQIVQWEMLIDIDPSIEHENTDKLDTKMSSDLLDLPFISEGEKSLATRNLLRGQSFLLPSGENVAECMGIAPDIINQVNQFIDENTAGINLSTGTPLWYYILAEAEAVGSLDRGPGEGLGPVGGRIVAETLIALLENDPTSYLGTDRSWSPTLGDGDFTLGDILSF